MITKVSKLLLLSLCLAHSSISSAFTISENKRTRHSSLLRNALSERQKQFWEDVEDGVIPIFSSYSDEMISSRIHHFIRSCKGEIAPHTGYLDFHQPCEEFVPGLIAKPYWQTSDEGCEWTEKLEQNAHIIIDEFNDVSKKNSGIFAGDSAWQNKVMGDGWGAIRLKRLGEWNRENCALFPITYELLLSLNIPLAVRGVCFARQAPMSGVAPHSDGRNFILTAHLGLKIPKEAWIKVGNEKRSWETGKAIVLDTSFEHSTGNPSTEDRFVLIIDFWHPELLACERECLELVYDLRNKFESGLVPFRTPRSSQKKQSISSLWGTLIGKKS